MDYVGLSLHGASVGLNSHGARWGGLRCAGLALRKPDRIVCYASSRLLRPFTLHCTRKRSAVEGEGAQQRKKGAADAGEPVGERSG